jgi:hypothetical protein
VLEVVAVNIDSNSKVHSAILGTSFLEMGRLVLEPEGESYFLSTNDTLNLLNLMKHDSLRSNARRAQGRHQRPRN